MKKEYIAPQITEINIGTEAMLAASIDKIPISETPKTPAASERRGEWGNLW